MTKEIFIHAAVEPPYGGNVAITWKINGKINCLYAKDYSVTTKRADYQAAIAAVLELSASPDDIILYSCNSEFVRDFSGIQVPDQSVNEYAQLMRIALKRGFKSFEVKKIAIADITDIRNTSFQILKNNDVKIPKKRQANII